MAATSTIEPAVRKIFRTLGRPRSVVVTAVTLIGSKSDTASGSASATTTGSAIATATVPSGGAGVV
jgi:hypothetical protein